MRCFRLALVAARRVALPAEPTAIGSRCDSDVASCNVVSGYAGNSVADGVSGAIVTGGGQRGAPNRVGGDYGTVAGGQGNLAGEGSTVAGGLNNTAVNFHTAVGGGANNAATAQEATVAGGFKNTASGRFAVVGGGSANVADDIHTTVAGGIGQHGDVYVRVRWRWHTKWSRQHSGCRGRRRPQPRRRARTAQSWGGSTTTLRDILPPSAAAEETLPPDRLQPSPGEFANAAAGDYSFAAGRQAEVQSNHPGTFLFADSMGLPFPSLAANEFAVRATGGVRIVSVDR